MVALEWEMRAVWPYVNEFIRPELAALGVPFTAISRATYATREFWGGADGKSLLLPAYSDQSGQVSKLPEYCSGEWKRDVMMRWAAEQPEWKARGVDNWVGISWEERRRRRAPRRKWMRAVYPLLDLRPTYVSGCLAAVERQGWPEPPRSRCRHCPNQSDGEWAELTLAEWQDACALEDGIRKVDPHAYFHKSLIPLRDVTLKPTPDGRSGGCSTGMCF